MLFRDLPGGERFIRVDEIPKEKGVYVYRKSTDDHSAWSIEFHRFVGSVEQEEVHPDTEVIRVR